MNAVTPRPERQPQDRIEELQWLRQWSGEYVSRVCQMDTQLCQLIAPAAVEKKSREAAARGPESDFVWIVLVLAHGHRLQRGRL